MQPDPGVQPGPALNELAAAMCRAQGPSQAVMVATAEVVQHVPSLTFVGLAVRSTDRQSVQYSILYSIQQGAARLGAVAASNCAAGIAIDTKQDVHIRDVLNGDLGLYDLQYLHQEHGARACFVAPLVVAHNALGALTLAAAQPDAFTGHIHWLHTVTAMCAPYMLLLKSHEGLRALEGLVGQIVPTRVALQLQSQQRRSSLQLPSDAVQQQLLPIAATDMSQGRDAHSSMIAQAAAAGHPGSQHTQPAAVQGAGDDHGARSSKGSSLSLLRQRLRQQRQQQQQPSGSPAVLHTQEQSPVQLRPPPPLPQQQQQQQQHSLPWSWNLVQPLLFQQPSLEQAYQRWALQQWLRLLDSIFLLLMLLSACGATIQAAPLKLPALHQAFLTQPWPMWVREFPPCVVLSGLLVLLVLWVGYTLRRLHTSSYLQWRGPSLAAVRVLRTLLFCCELWQLSPKIGGRAQQELSLQGRWHWQQVFGGVSEAAVASCTLLLLLGLLCQLRAWLQASVQATCLALVYSTLMAVRVHSLSGSAGYAGVGLSALREVVSAGWLECVVLVMVGWVLPMLLGAAVNWGSRHLFLRKIT